MSDFIVLLQKDPDNAIKSIKPTNIGLLTDIWNAIPAAEKAGINKPERGIELKNWLINWGKHCKAGGGTAASAPAPAAAAAAPAAAPAPATTPATPSAAAAQRNVSAPPPAAQEAAFESAPAATATISRVRVSAADTANTAAAVSAPGGPSSSSSSSFSSSSPPPMDAAASFSDAAACGDCANCRKKDAQIKKLHAIIQGLLGQMEDLVLETRGDVTVAMS